MEFSDEQKEKLKELNQEVRSRMSEILTSEQQDDLRASVKAGNNPQEAIKTLDLSDEQKGKLKKVQKWQRKRLSNILNNEQKRKIMQMRQRQGRGSRFNIRG
jgi:Spy/CpxP family protein refolding chaperone